METGAAKPHFSIPSIIAIGAAIASFYVSPAAGFLLAIVAVVFGVIGFLLSLLPSTRGGLISLLSLVLAAVGIVIAIFKFIHAAV
jgi:hypothetical protein